MKSPIFLITIPIVSFSCLIPSARYINIILNNNGDRELMYYVPFSNRKISNVFPLKRMLAWFLIDLFFYVKKISFNSYSLKCFDIY